MNHNKYIYFRFFYLKILNQYNILTINNICKFIEYLKIY